MLQGAMALKTPPLHIFAPVGSKPEPNTNRALTFGHSEPSRRSHLSTFPMTRTQAEVGSSITFHKRTGTKERASQLSGSCSADR